MSVKPFNIEIVKTESMTVSEAVLIASGSTVKKSSALIIVPTINFSEHNDLLDARKIVDWLGRNIPASTMDHVRNILAREK